MSEHKAEVVTPGVPECQWCQRTHEWLEMMIEGSGIEKKSKISRHRKHGEKHYSQAITLILNMYFYHSIYVGHEQTKMLCVLFCEIDATMQGGKTTCKLSMIWSLKVIERGLAIFGHSGYNLSLSATARTTVTSSLTFR